VASQREDIMSSKIGQIVGHASAGVVEAWAEARRLQEVARAKAAYNKFLTKVSGGKRRRPVAAGR
jgi:hypothetical protein